MLGGPRPGESQHEFVQRSGREAEARWAAEDARRRPCIDPSICAIGPSVQDIANGRQ